jgi:hypothetical protein
MTLTNKQWRLSQSLVVYQTAEVIAGHYWVQLDVEHMPLGNSTDFE